MSDKRTPWGFFGYKALLLTCNKGLSSTGSDAKPLYGASFSLDVFYVCLIKERDHNDPTSASGKGLCLNAIHTFDTTVII